MPMGNPSSGGHLQSGYPVGILSFLMGVVGGMGLFMEAFGAEGIVLPQ